jgi:uncharacterized protein (DUF952 family)
LCASVDKIGAVMADARLQMNTTAYKVLTAADWAALRAGTFLGSPVDLADGFIHLSTASQLTETVERHFPGWTGLIVAAIDLTSLGDAVRWEPSRHGELFPHVYAPLTPRVVLAWCPLQRHADGAVRLPERVP